MEQDGYVFPVFSLFAGGLRRLCRLKCIFMLVQRKIANDQSQFITVFLQDVFDNRFSVSTARTLIIGELDYGYRRIVLSPGRTILRRDCIDGLLRRREKYLDRGSLAQLFGKALF